MMGTTFPTERLPEHDGATLFESVGNLLREADIAAGNLEGVLCVFYGFLRLMLPQNRGITFRKIHDNPPFIDNNTILIV